MNHKRKRPHWSKLCMCKYYKQAGNGHNRRSEKENLLRRIARDMRAVGRGDLHRLEDLDL